MHVEFPCLEDTQNKGRSYAIEVVFLHHFLSQVMEDTAEGRASQAKITGCYVDYSEVLEI
jgi:hypothetical protein